MCGVTFVPGETAGSSVFPLSAMLFPKPKVNPWKIPLRQPENLTFLFGQQWLGLYATYFKSSKMASASVVGAIVMKLSRVLRDDVVAYNWL